MLAVHVSRATELLLHLCL